MTTPTGVWASTASAQNLHKITVPDISAKSADSSSESDSSTISANDFLTLLVTEMKNQDPTATTDPNEYINQLVGVNSLQQLISINQTLSDDLSAKPDSSAPAATTPTKTVPSSLAHGVPAMPVVDRTITGTAMRHSSGNLDIPAASAAAQRVANALDRGKSSL